MKGCVVSITVQMSAPYLGLTHLVSAMAEAAVNSSRTSEELQNPEEMQSAAAETWEAMLRDLAKRQSIRGYDWDSNRVGDWQHLDIERDLFFVDDLNDCEELTDLGFRFVVVENESDSKLFLDYFDESVNNSEPIDWGYWVWKMPELSTGEAARLLVGLDPDLFKDLSVSPNDNDTSRTRKRALNIERLAVREGRKADTPFGWLLWATEQGFQVHGGYSREVNAKKEREDATSALRELPEKEVATWNEATPVADGRRQVTFDFAGNVSTRHFTLPQFVGEVADRIARWHAGEYAVIEAAQLLADATPALDAKTLTEQMEQAMHAGKLVLRKNGLPVPPKEVPVGRVWNRFVRADDVNDWLTASGARYRLTYPYANALRAEQQHERRVSDEDWKLLAQQYAREYVRQQRDRNLFPSQEDLGDHVAKRFRTEGVVGADGKPLAGATIKRHALKGISSAVGKRLSTATSQGK